MAKFATALCILLVACYTTATTTESISTALTEEYSDVIEEAEETMSDGLSEIYATTQAFMDKVNNVTQNLINQHNEKIAELSQGVSVGDVAICLTSSGNFTETIQAVATNVIACANTALSNVLADYQTAKTSLQEFQELINSIKEEADACVSNLTITSAACLAKLMVTAQIDVAKKSVAVVANVATFANSVANLRENFQNCATVTVIATLATKALKYYVQFKECIDNLNSTSTA